MLEVSSFQLETIETFHPKIAVVLNVTPDHLDRHHTFENYAAAKARIFENQTSNDFAVLNADDATCVAMADRTQSRTCTGSAASGKSSTEHSCAATAILWRDADSEQTHHAGRAKSR